MPDRFSVFNSNSIYRGIRDFALIGLIGLMAVKVPEVMRTAMESSRYDARRTEISKLMDDGQFEKSVKMLAGYEKGNILTPEDIQVMKDKLVEKRKSARIKALDGLISDVKPDEARREYDSLVKEGIIPEGKRKEYFEKVDAISLESMVAKVSNEKGMGKIEMIEGVVKNFPSYARITDLKKRQLATYLEMTRESLESSTPEGQTAAFLKGFEGWIKNQPKEVLKGADANAIAQLATLGKKYSERMKTIGEYSLGNRVVVRRNMGNLNPYWNGNNDKFFFEGEIKQCPLGTKGVITGITNEKEAFQVTYSAPDGKLNNIHLIRSELEQDIFTLNEVSSRLQTIQNYISSANGVSGGAK